MFRSIIDAHFTGDPFSSRANGWKFVFRDYWERASRVPKKRKRKRKLPEKPKRKIPESIVYTATFHLSFAAVPRAIRFQSDLPWNSLQEISSNFSQSKLNFTILRQTSHDPIIFWDGISPIYLRFHATAFDKLRRFVSLVEGAFRGMFLINKNKPREIIETATRKFRFRRRQKRLNWKQMTRAIVCATNKWENRWTTRESRCGSSFSVPSGNSIWNCQSWKRKTRDSRHIPRRFPFRQFQCSWRLLA